MTAPELQTLLDALKRARYSGLQSVTQGNMTMVWRSDAELEMKINALTGELNSATNASTNRSRSTLTTYSPQ